MIQGLNHLTLAVVDLERAFDFYVTQLNLRPLARWRDGAYLAAGDLWLCLSVDPQRAEVVDSSYTHVALTVARADFAAMCERLRDAGVPEWKANTSEGDSRYLLDPDGHRLELHVGDVASRLAACRRAPYEGMEFFD